VEKKGTTYAVMSFGTFVCTRCSGLHRDLNYKVKGIGVSNFSEAELALLTTVGNDNAREIWLAKFDSKKEKLPDSKDSEAVRKHIKAKYTDKKYCGNSEKETKPKKEKESSKNKKSQVSDSDSEEEETPKVKVKTTTKGLGIPSQNQIINNQTTNSSKLNPLQMKSQSGSGPNTVGSNGVNIKKIGQTNDNGGWANFSEPSKTDGQFTFTDSNSKNNNGVDPNMFEFTENTVKTQNTNNKNENWGNIWDNSPTPVTIPQKTSLSSSNIMEINFFQIKIMFLKLKLTLIL